MTDAELLRLIEENLPDELTDEQIAELRQRLTESGDLRRALRENLRFEQWLGDGLGTVRISAKQIIQAADRFAVKQSRQRWLFTAGLVATSVLLAFGVIWLTRQPSKSDTDGRSDRVVTDRTNESDADRKGQRTSPDKDNAATSRPSDESKSATTSLTNSESDQEARPATRPTAANEMFRDWPELAPGTAIKQPFGQICFDGFGTRGLSSSQLQRWLMPVAGERSRFFDYPRSKIGAAGFDGLVRLRAPWPSDAVLRITPFDHDGLTLHFWNGREGVTLRHYQHPRPMWGAFETERTGTNPQPASYVLVGTDDGRVLRVGSGTVEVRHQDGTLILSRGDVRLIAVPLSEPPTEVYFDRRATFRGFTMYRGTPFPDESEPERPIVLRADQPASLNWVSQLPDRTTLENLSDDAVELRAEPDAELCWAAIPLPRSGLFEVTCLVEDASPATGIYLGDADGRPVHTVSFQRDPKTGQLGFGLRTIDEAASAGRFEAPQEAAPVAGRHTWLRLVLGTMHLKCWTSGDGEHWSRAVEPRAVTPQACSHVGLFCARTGMLRKITLRLCVVRELDGLTSLGDTELSERVPESVTRSAANLLNWTDEVRNSRPADVEAARWRTACNLRTLAAAPPPAIANTILYGVLSDHLGSTLPLDRRLRMLEDAALLADTWSIGDCQNFLQHYERLARTLIRQGDTRPFRTLHTSLLTAPLWCDGRFDASPVWLARHELLQLVFRDRWAEARELSQQFRFWNDSGRQDEQWTESQRRLRDLVDWVAATADRRLPTDAAKTRDAAPLAAAWRQPLMLEFSKEAYNTLAEVLAAASEKSFEDAGKIITSASQLGRELTGLIPDAQDDKLLVSYSRAVANLLQDTPELQQTLIERFGSLGLLRVQEAIANDDEAAVRGVTLEFPSTDAAARAHLWLGDLALSAGEFAIAAREYRQAERIADPVVKAVAQSRSRLASAFAGRAATSGGTEPLVLNDVRLSVVDFENLLAEIRNRPRDSGALAESAADRAAVVPSLSALAEPAELNVGRRLGWEAKYHEAGSVPISNVDWIARQTAWASAESLLVTSNRQQVAAFDLKQGESKWTFAEDVNAAKSSRWPLVVMRPLLIGDRALVRRLTKDGPILMCFDADSGRVVWSSRSGVAVVSDPVVHDGELRAVTTAGAPQDVIQLELATINAETGDFVSRLPLVQLRDVWDRQVPCQAAAAEDGLLVAAGGCVLRCDADGDIVWLRRQTWIPATVDPASSEQSRDAPLTDGDRVLFTQPGVFTLDCVNAESGRLLWQRVFPELRRVLGLADGRLLVRTSETLQALDLRTSETAWERDASVLLDAVLIGKPTRLLLAEREPMPSGQSRPKLVWIELATGRELGAAPLDGLNDKQPCLGPIIPQPDRLWAIFGRGTTNSNRELLELIR